MTEMMRAVQADKAGPPEEMVIREVPKPDPGEGEARLKVAYVGMNPLDALIRSGALDFFPVDWPFTPGIEHTGIVDAVGPGVDEALIGKRVISRATFSGCAEYSVSPAATLIPLDDRIDLRTGCVYRGATSTAWCALHKSCHVQSGETVLLHSAAGPVAIMAAQIAKDAGCTVIGLAGGDAKCAFASEYGYDHVIDYKAEDWPEKVMELTDGRGVDIIIDGVGGPAASKNYGVIAPLGRILFIGATSGPQADPPPTGLMIGKSFSIGGMSVSAVEDPPSSAAQNEIVEAIASERWKVPITEGARLDDVPMLHRRMEDRQIMGRAVISVAGDL